MCVWGAILIMCCCGLGSPLSPPPPPPPSRPLSLPRSARPRRRPSSSLFPLSVVPVTTLPAVNRRGDGQRGIKRRRESSWNWLHVGHGIFIPPRSVSHLLPRISPIPFLNIFPSPFTLIILYFYTFFSSVFLHHSPFPFSYLLLSFHISFYLSSCQSVLLYHSLISLYLLSLSTSLFLRLSFSFPSFTFSDPLSNFYSVASFIQRPFQNAIKKTPHYAAFTCWTKQSQYNAAPLFDFR